MTTTKTQTYWERHDQMVVCIDHAGMYLTEAIKAHPRARQHQTPIGEFYKLSNDDVAEIQQMREEFNLPTSDTICEICISNARNK